VEASSRQAFRRHLGDFAPSGSGSVDARRSAMRHRPPPCASAPYRAATPFEDPPHSVESTMMVSDSSSPRSLEVVPCWRSQSRPSFEGGRGFVQFLRCVVGAVALGVSGREASLMVHAAVGAERDLALRIQRQVQVAVVLDPSGRAALPEFARLLGVVLASPL
jgi:hypothetical protein